VDSPGEGHGTTTTVALPLPTSRPPTPRTAISLRPWIETEKAWTVSDREALEGVRLLVVEDDADSREMLVMLCRARGSGAW